MCSPPNCNHKQLSRLLKSSPHNTVSRNGYSSFLNLTLYSLDSPSPSIYRVWFLIMSNLQSNYQISRSNYVGFSSIVKKHQSMTCLTFSLFYFAMIEAIQPQVPYFKMLYLAQHEMNTCLVQYPYLQTSGFFTEGSLFFTHHLSNENRKPRYHTASRKLMSLQFLWVFKPPNARGLSTVTTLTRSRTEGSRKGKRLSSQAANKTPYFCVFYSKPTYPTVGGLLGSQKKPVQVRGLGIQEDSHSPKKAQSLEKKYVQGRTEPETKNDSTVHCLLINNNS